MSRSDAHRTQGTCGPSRLTTGRASGRGKRLFESGAVPYERRPQLLVGRQEPPRVRLAGAPVAATGRPRARPLHPRLQLVHLRLRPDRFGQELHHGTAPRGARTHARTRASERIKASPHRTRCRRWATATRTQRSAASCPGCAKGCFRTSRARRGRRASPSECATRPCTQHFRRDPAIRQVEASMLEIYNDCVRDLCNPRNNPPHGLVIRNHPRTGPYVEGLSTNAVTSYEQIDRCPH
jgi:hypothetical protein